MKKGHKHDASFSAQRFPKYGSDPCVDSSCRCPTHLSRRRCGGERGPFTREQRQKNSDEIDKLVIKVIRDCADGAVLPASYPSAGISKLLVSLKKPTKQGYQLKERRATRMWVSRTEVSGPTLHSWAGTGRFGTDLWRWRFGS